MPPSRADRSRGQILPFFAISLVVLMAMGALLLDGAQALTVRRRLQDAADAASLAAANVVRVGAVKGCSATAGPPPGTPRSAVVAAAQASVAANLPWYPQGNVAVTCPSGYANYAVRVNLATTSPTFLGGVIGRTNMAVGAAGTAMNGGLTAVKYSVVVLDPSNPSWTKLNGCPAVLFSGGPTVTFDGTLQINSACLANNNGALGTNGNAAQLTVANGANVRIVGDYVPGALTISPAPLVHQLVVDDPLAKMTPLQTASMTVRATSKTTFTNGTHLLEPGIYRGGIQLKAQAVAFLHPGIYVMDGGGFDLGAQSSIYSIPSSKTSTSDATWATDCPVATCGVLIYNGGMTSSLGQFTAGGGATIMLRPFQPTFDTTTPATEEYENLLFWQAPTPVPTSTYQQPPVALQGGGLVNLSGTVYAPSAAVEMGGNAGGTGGGLNVTLQFIAYELSLQGNSSFHFYFQDDAFAKPTDYGLVE